MLLQKKKVRANKIVHSEPLVTTNAKSVNYIAVFSKLPIHDMPKNHMLNNLLVRIQQSLDEKYTVRFPDVLLRIGSEGDQFIVEKSPTIQKLTLH